MAISAAWLATALLNGAGQSAVPAEPGTGPNYPAPSYPAPSYPAPSYRRSHPLPPRPGRRQRSDDAVTDSGEQAVDDAERAADGEEDQADEESSASGQPKSARPESALPALGLVRENAP